MSALLFPPVSAWLEPSEKRPMPACCVCKGIRVGSNAFVYAPTVLDSAGGNVTHGFCPRCYEAFYGLKLDDAVEKRPDSTAEKCAAGLQMALRLIFGPSMGTGRVAKRKRLRKGLKLGIRRAEKAMRICDGMIATRPQAAVALDVNMVRRAAFGLRNLRVGTLRHV